MPREAVAEPINAVFFSACVAFHDDLVLFSKLFQAGLYCQGHLFFVVSVDLEQCCI